MSINQKMQLPYPTWISFYKLKNFHVDMKIHSEIEDNVLDNKIKYILKNQDYESTHDK